MYKARLSVRLCIAMALALKAEAASPVYTPAANTADRAAIMDTIREGTASASRFKVGYLKVVGLSGDKFAFAEVTQADQQAAYFFNGWALLTKPGNGMWRLLWAVRSSGESKCVGLQRAYSHAVSVAAMADAPMNFFSPTFLAHRAAQLPRDPQEMCPGSVIVGD